MENGTGCGTGPWELVVWLKTGRSKASRRRQREQELQPADNAMWWDLNLSESSEGTTGIKFIKHCMSWLLLNHQHFVHFFAAVRTIPEADEMFWINLQIAHVFQNQIPKYAALSDHQWELISHKRGIGSSARALQEERAAESDHRPLPMEEEVLVGGHRDDEWGSMRVPFPRPLLPFAGSLWNLAGWKNASGRLRRGEKMA